MKILNQIKITAGRRHAWYETDLGLPIRKPLGVIKRAPTIDSVPLPQQVEAAKPWRKRLLDWLRNLFI